MKLAHTLQLLDIIQDIIKTWKWYLDYFGNNILYCFANISKTDTYREKSNKYCYTKKKIAKFHKTKLAATRVSSCLTHEKTNCNSKHIATNLTLKEHQRVKISSYTLSKQFEIAAFVFFLNTYRIRLSEM